MAVLAVFDPSLSRVPRVVSMLPTCIFLLNPGSPDVSDILTKLATVLEARKTASPDSSYVASLYAKGLDAILKKIGEEATETVIAAKTGDRQQVISEMADLWFHTLVLLAQQGLRPEEILQELDRRFGLSGLEEKSARKEKGR